MKPQSHVRGQPRPRLINPENRRPTAYGFLHGAVETYKGWTLHAENGRYHVRREGLSYWDVFDSLKAARAYMRENA